MTSKTYGKFTPEQLQRVVEKLPEVRDMTAKIEKEMGATSPEKLKELLGSNYSWAWVYELPFHAHMGLASMVLGAHNEISKAAQSEDPQETFLNSIDQDNPDENWKGGYEGLFEDKDLIGIVTATMKTIQSLMFYQKSLSALVNEVRNGNDRALFNAVRIDRTITGCSTISDRISLAELQNDKKFFQHLRNALKGPSAKHWQGSFKDLRFLWYILRDLGITTMTDEQLESLMVDQLKLYPRSPSARKNLRKQYTASKKIQEPQMII